MKAKDMFEELKYEKWESNEIIIYKREQKSIRFNLMNTPYLKKDSISIFFEPDEAVYEQEIVLTYDELRAINKQVEELGWNNASN